jgi:hypothetical protein
MEDKELAKELFRKIAKLIDLETVQGDEDALQLCEMILKSDYSFTIRRMALNALSPVSDEPFFKEIMAKLRKSCEDEIGEKLY